MEMVRFRNSPKTVVVVQKNAWKQLVLGGFNRI